jgi:predicted PurR-regulated permease PerM
MLQRRLRPSHDSITEVMGYVLAGCALVGVAIAVHDILSPFVVVGAVIYLLYPFRRHVFVGRAMMASFLLLLLWGFNAVASLLVPFIIAFVFAYLFDPLVSTLSAHRIPRWVGSLVVVLCLVGVIVCVALFVTPVIGGQMESLVDGIGRLVEGTRQWFASDEPTQVLARMGIPVDRARELLTTQLVPRIEGVLSSLVAGVFSLVTGVSALAVQILNIIIIPFVMFFLLMDFPHIGKKFVALFPARRQDGVRSVIATVDGVAGRYIRGAVIVATIQGTVAAIVLWAIGVSSPLVLGLMTAVLDFIPYVGLIVSLVVGVIVALFSGDPISAKVIGVIILYLAEKLLEATVLAPKIIGSQVGLHPVVLILSLMLFGYFLGFAGLLIAVPSTALMLVALDRWGVGRTV